MYDHEYSLGLTGPGRQIYWFHGSPRLANDLCHSAGWPGTRRRALQFAVDHARSYIYALAGPTMHKETVISQMVKKHNEHGK